MFSFMLRKHTSHNKLSLPPLTPWAATAASMEACPVAGAAAAPSDGAVAVAGEVTDMPAAAHPAMKDMDSVFY